LSAGESCTSEASATNQFVAESHGSSNSIAVSSMTDSTCQHGLSHIAIEQEKMDCLACGPTASRASNEHVFSKWPLKEFEPDASMPLYRRLDDGTEKQTRKDVRLDSFRLKEVCDSCNNGWMSKLENDAKPAIVDLIRGRRELTSLTEEERKIVAGWAGKTAIVESRTIGAECPVSGDCLKQIRTGTARTAAEFAVAACVSGKKSFAHLQVGIIRDLIGGGKAAGNIIIIAIPNLAFASAFPMLPIPFQCRCVKSLYTPLWPAPEHWRDMDQTPRPTGQQGMENLLPMSERIELFQSIQ